jgi:deazaflavin-dependent oxidoreductase (nitroreductase family)
LTPRHTPVAYFPDGADSWLIVASANGAAKNPAWYYNLAAHPDTVQIQIAGRTIEVSAEQLHGTARQHAWRHITSTADLREIRAENRPRTPRHPAAHPTHPNAVGRTRQLCQHVPS